MPVLEEKMRSSLPAHIRERVRLAKPGKDQPGRVVYWMRLALRGHENPALDAGLLVAEASKVPFVVLLQVEDQYQHASARRQMFLLQGARCTQQELAQRGIPTIVQIDRKGQGAEAISTLAKSASLVIAEEPFCCPWLAGVEKLQHGDFQCPLWLVDCSSVVPSVLVPKQSCHRAYTYENTTKQMHESRISMPWKDVEVPIHIGTTSDDIVAEMQSMDLQNADLPGLVAEMDVDHKVKPVEHTVGGSTHGYARWSAWIAAGGLKTYAKRRNESLDVQGVSRMSAYLNAGMVSPLRVAREANAAAGAGKGKFLNEFLTWRGLTYAWCYHFPMPASGCTLAQLPSWASDTLRKHASDPRSIISRDRLANANSGDRAWDGMQRYLNQTGELHNNARMGWGCAIPKWTASPEGAMHTLIDLNNTFALDGHAPPSYGGLLGCLGLFTGPKGESAIYGKVSARSPKAKYAEMPSQIPTLHRGLDLEHISRSDPILKTAQEDLHSPQKTSRKAMVTPAGRSLPESFARAWRPKAKETEDKTSMPNITLFDDDAASKKRRWSNLKGYAEQTTTIEID